jgi:hypothetical protein
VHCSNSGHPNLVSFKNGPGRSASTLFSHGAWRSSRSWWEKRGRRRLLMRGPCVHAKDKGSNSLASFSSHQALDQQAGRASIAWGPALLLAWPTARVRKSQGVQSGRGKKASYCSSSFLSRLCHSISFFLEKETWLHQTGEGNNTRAENGKRKRLAGMR